LSNDQILKMNGASTERMDLQDVINHLRGSPGQKISLTLIRPSTKEVRDYALERAEIKVQSVKSARLLDADLTGSFKIAYVRLIQFNEPTAEELSKTIDDLQKQGMQALILDLRNNPGGLLNSAVDFWTGFGPRRDAIARRLRVAFYDREILHAEQTGDSRQRSHPEHPSADEPGTGTARFHRPQQRRHDATR